MAMDGKSVARLFEEKKGKKSLFKKNSK